MFNSHRYKALLYLKGVTITSQTTMPPLKLHPLLQHTQFPFSLKFCTATSDPLSFAASYLVNNFGFSPEFALKASKRVRFGSSQKPDSVLAFFRNQGFSDSQINSMVRRFPELLSCNTQKRVLPKFEFLLSKGASTSDIVRIVTRSPEILKRSLENRIIPAYKLMYRFFQSDKKTLASVNTYPFVLFSYSVAINVKLLLENGVSDSNIFRILRARASVLCYSGLRKTVEELISLGFDPSKSSFGIALVARRSVSESQWNEKIDTFKSWGWSEETILEAFRRQPFCMLASNDKINKVMRFWVTQLGWNSSHLVKAPGIFGYSLEKRIIPRASVLYYLLSKGLRKKSASLYVPFCMSEIVFLQKFVICFKGEETSQLLKLYQENMNLEDNKLMLCSSNI